MIDKQRWAESHWKQFVAEYQEAQIKWDVWWYSLPYCHGLTESIASCERTIHKQFYRTLTRSIESLYIHQCPNTGTSFIFKREIPYCERSKTKGWKNQVISREEWIEFGAKFQVLEFMFQELEIKFKQTAYQIYYVEFERLNQKIAKLKSRLMLMVENQHPDWENGMEVFCPTGSCQIPTWVIPIDGEED